MERPQTPRAEPAAGGMAAASTQAPFWTGAWVAGALLFLVAVRRGFRPVVVRMGG